MTNLFRYAFIIFALGFFGCGSGGGGGGSATPVTTETVSAIELLAVAPVVGTNEATEITVRLYNASGQLFSGQKTVIFAVDNPALGSIQSSVSTANGLATATFTSREVEGDVVLTASVDDASKDLTIQISDQASAASISISSSPMALTVGGTSVFKARVLDVNGNPMADGTLVNFEVNNSSLGSIVPNATVSGGNGEAQATFSASSENVGSATVKATCGNVSQSIIIDIAASPSGSIEFSSAEPQVIVIKGAGGLETSLINFLVKDVNGQPVLGSQSVQLRLSGPNGGEYIGSVPGTTILDVGTVDGIASAYLHSGTVPGTVTIEATVVGTNLSTSSGVIAIGGGVPSAAHFSLSASNLKLEGFDKDGLESSIDVRLADRYGNFNVLSGTSVSFYSECGAIDRAINLDSEGFGTVRFRTQEPRPVSLPIDGFYYNKFKNELGVELSDAKNPQNGICTIVAVVDGEEKFIDSNANGNYDFGETYYDTYDDVHLDKDDDSLDLDTISYNLPHDILFEDLIYDKNKNGLFDGKNTTWDASKKIVKYFKIAFTYDGAAPEITVAQKNISGIFDEVVDNVLVSGRDVNFAIHDINFNDPISGTKYEISVDNVQPPSVTEYTFTDSSNIGATIFKIKPEIKDLTKAGTLTITWTWKGTDYSKVFTVN